MPLSADHYFCIGASHSRAGEPCQDYALSGTLPDGRIYGIVADGCSGARARTDLGARVLALALEEELRQSEALADCFTPASIQRIVSRLVSRPLGGEPADYLASVVAFCADAACARIYMAGDGVWATSADDGTLTLTELTWKGNAPLYLGYALTPWTLEEFLRQPEPAAQLVTRSLRRDAQEGWVERSRSESPLLATELVHGSVREVSLPGLKSLAVYSDGVSQVKNASTENMVEASLAFKNYVGSFVKRRMLSDLNRRAKSGEVPEDDFAMAALARGQEGSA